MKTETSRPDASADREGCAFILDCTEGDVVQGRRCAAPLKSGSAYCPKHHARCHLANGSAGERRKLREIEALAKAVGGRQGRPARQPPIALLRRLNRTAQQSCSDRSCIVLEENALATERTPRREPARPTSTAPTAERYQHGPVERLERAIGDAAGQPSRPYRAVDTLAVMQRRGSITAGMKQAGEDFRARFRLAQLDPLRALDPSHLRLGDASPRLERNGTGLRIEAARRAVWRAIQTVGGIGSPAGSCLWHVLGWERSLKEWALEQGWSGRRVSQEAASGILVAALGALEAHFSGMH